MSIKAYKGFDKDLKCRGFQYEVGKTYTTDEAELCKKGFHACLKPIDVFRYYTPSDSRFCEVLIEGVCEGENENDSKVCGTSITIVKEFTFNEFMSLIMAGLNAENGSVLQAGSGSALKAGDCSALQAGSGSALKAGDCSALQTGSGSALKAGNRSALQAGSGSVLQTGSYSALNAGDYSALQAGYYSALRAGDGSALNAGGCSALKAGNYSALRAGDGSALQAGNRSVLKAGDGSALKAGSISIVYGGVGSRVSGGRGSVLAIIYEKTRYIYDVAVTKVDGKRIKPGVFYELNEKHRFVKSKIQEAVIR